MLQTLTTTYASEIVPTILRHYLTAYVCICWGAGILLSSGVVRAMVVVQGDLGWRLPFGLQWVWPLPLILASYLAPESPWNSVRRGNKEEARRSLTRLRIDGSDREANVRATLAYIEYTTELEKAESADADYLACFRGTNLRRTEIVSSCDRHTPRYATMLTREDRIASFGPLKSSVVMPSWAIPWSSSNKLDSPKFKPSTSTSRSRHATSSAA